AGFGVTRWTEPRPQLLSGRLRWRLSRPGRAPRPIGEPDPRPFHDPPRVRQGTAGRWQAGFHLDLAGPRLARPRPRRPPEPAAGSIPRPFRAGRLTRAPRDRSRDLGTHPRDHAGTGRQPPRPRPSDPRRPRQCGGGP